MGPPQTSPPRNNIACLSQRLLAWSQKNVVAAETTHPSWRGVPKKPFPMWPGGKKFGPPFLGPKPLLPKGPKARPTPIGTKEPPSPLAFGPKTPRVPRGPPKAQTSPVSSKVKKPPSPRARTGNPGFYRPKGLPLYRRACQRVPAQTSKAGFRAQGPLPRFQPRPRCVSKPGGCPA